MLSFCCRARGSPGAGERGGGGEGQTGEGSCRGTGRREGQVLPPQPGHYTWYVRQMGKHVCMI